MIRAMSIPDTVTLHVPLTLIKRGGRKEMQPAETRAVVVVEHDMDFVSRLNCKVTVLHQGAVLAEGSLDHVSANPQVIEVYLGR